MTLRLAHLLLLHRGLGSSREDATPEERSDRLLYHFPSSTNLDSCLSMMETFEALIDFAAATNHQPSPCPLSVTLSPSTHYLACPGEPLLWLCAEFVQVDESPPDPEDLPSRIFASLWSPSRPVDDDPLPSTAHASLQHVLSQTHELLEVCLGPLSSQSNSAVRARLRRLVPVLLDHLLPPRPHCAAQFDCLARASAPHALPPTRLVLLHHSAVALSNLPPRDTWLLAQLAAASERAGLDLPALLPPDSRVCLPSCGRIRLVPMRRRPLLVLLLDPPDSFDASALLMLPSPQPQPLAGPAHIMLNTATRSLRGSGALTSSRLDLPVARALDWVWERLANDGQACLCLGHVWVVAKKANMRVLLALLPAPRTAVEAAAELDKLWRLRVG